MNYRDHDIAQNPAQRRLAFTVTELLASVAVAAVLIAIMIPVLARTRRQSEQSQCLSNIRACGNALLLHAGENRMELALPWGGDESTMNNESLRARYPDIESHPQFKKSWIDFLADRGYLNSAAGYCPSHMPISRFSDPKKLPWGFAYGMRRYNTVSSQYQPMNMATQGRTRNFVLLGDSIRSDTLQWYYTHHPAGGSGNQFHFRHDGRALFFLLDGSVLNLTPDELINLGDGWRNEVVNTSLPVKK